MRTLVTFDPVGGDRRRLVAADGRWADPDDGPTDRVIDLTGRWAIRGLVDAHAHLGADSLADVAGPATTGDPRIRAFAHLAAGVFLVHDKGHSDGSLLWLAGEPPAEVPDLEMAGRILHPPGGYYPGYGVEVDLADLEAEVAAAARGAQWVKLIGDWPKPGHGATPNFDEDHLATAVRVAHGAGCRVAIHTAAPRTPSMAVAAGVDSIEHGLFLGADDVATLGARNGLWVPTLRAMETVRAGLRAGSTGDRLLAQGLDNARSLLADAAAAGVVILAGTDLAAPHGGVAREAPALAEAGLGSEGAFRALAVDGWSASGRHPMPSVGESADLVAFGADPRLDPAVLAEPELVMRAGRVLVERQ